MIIEHLALDGGGPFGLITLGALIRSRELGIWAMQDIKSMRAISSGALVAVSVLLHEDWQTIRDYYTHRPWAECLCPLLTNIPICSDRLCSIILEPLITSAGFTTDLTFGQLYAKTNIELIIIVSRISGNLETINLSFKTNPNMKIITACAMSCALIPLFRPMLIDNTSYVDGGFSTGNYALYKAPGYVFEKGLHFVFTCRTGDKCELTTGLHGITSIIFAAMIDGLRKLNSEGKKAYREVKLLREKSTIEEWLSVINLVEVREKYVENGSKSIKTLICSHLIHELSKKW